MKIMKIATSYINDDEATVYHHSIVRKSRRKRWWVQPLNESMIYKGTGITSWVKLVIPIRYNMPRGSFKV